MISKMYRVSTVLGSALGLLLLLWLEWRAAPVSSLFVSKSFKHSLSPSIEHAFNSPSCSFGTLPGWWDSKAELGSRWRLLDPHCQLHNYISDYTKHSADINSSSRSPLPQIGMLFLGDSVDSFMLEDFCKLAHGTWRQDGLQVDVNAKPAHSYYAINWCECEHLVLAQFFILSVARDGSYFLNHNMSWQSRIAHVKDVWHSKLKLPPPQLVILHCALWDLARIAHTGVYPMLKNVNELPSEFLQEWMANLTSLVQFARSTFGQVGMVGT